MVDESARLARHHYLPRKHIAAKLGIDETTFSRWMSRGASDGRGIYRRLFVEVRRAEAERLMTILDALSAAGSENPKVLQWLLSRLDPSEFGRRDNVTAVVVEDRAAQEQATQALLFERLE